MYVVPRCVYIYIRDVIEDSVQNKCLIGHRGVRGFGVWQTMWKHVKVYDGFCALQPTWPLCAYTDLYFNLPNPLMLHRRRWWVLEQDHHQFLWMASNTKQQIPTPPNRTVLLNRPSLSTSRWFVAWSTPPLWTFATGAKHSFTPSTSVTSPTPLPSRTEVPDHAWYDCKPNISHLRIFGSLAYVNILKKLRGGKLEATSNKS